MTIFNNSIRDAEFNIIYFLENNQKIVFSGVNKTTYQLLSNNDYFKKLFECHHPQLSTSSTFKDKKNLIQYLSDRHPTNCWKVASCIFQTGRLNFSSLFLNAAIPSEIKKLTEERATLETELAEVSAKFDQAKLAHQQTQYLLESDDLNCEAIRIGTSLDREAEFGNFFLNMVPNLQTKLSPREPSKDDLLQALLEFDRRFLPVTNLATYQGLDRRRASLQTTLEGVKHSLTELQKPDFIFKNERNNIRILFNNNLEDFLLELVNNPKNLNESYITTFKSFLIIYAITTIADESMKTKYTSFISTCINLLSKTKKFRINKEDEKNLIFNSNIEKINNIIEKQVYENALNESLISIAEAGFSIKTFIYQVERLFDYGLESFDEYRNKASEEMIKADLRREIQARYGDEALMKLDESVPKS